MRVHRLPFAHIALIAIGAATVFARPARARQAGDEREPPIAVAEAVTAASPGADAAAACAGPATSDTLSHATYRDATARAYWLSRRRLQWPGAPADGRYAIYRSSGATLQLSLGAAVEGADARIPLARDDSPLPRAIAERFRFVGAGARLALPAAAQRDLPQLLREQLVLVREDAERRVLAATAIQLPGALDDRYSAAATVRDLGVTLAAHGANGARVALWAPTARAVSVCVYPRATGDSASVHPLALDAATGIWLGRLAGDLRGAGYLYLVELFVPGAGLVRNRVTDPYSVALTANSQRSVFLSLDDPRTQPEGWARSPRPAPLAAATDLAVYELHVRDFSAQDTTVRPAWRGKYLAFTEAQSAGMRHLRALQSAGITDVHLLPVYDLSTVPEVGCIVPDIPSAAPNSELQQAAVSAVRERDCFNWGYDPFHYTAPEGSYATDANDAAARIREFRAMVQALHAAGLRAGMDVVYNHTFASGQDPRSVLDRIVPGYYHRLDAEGRVARSTCCENTATEYVMMAKLMVESAATWVRHYRIDSFRFDLMGHQPRAAMERLQRAVNAAAGRHVPLIGEGWDFGEVANGARFVQASQRSLGGSGIATFSDRARDALRGGGCCDGGEALVANQGLLNGLHYAPNAANAGRDRRAELLRAADMARIGLAGTLASFELTGADGVRRPLARFDYAGQPAGYAQEPGEVVNYVENHDNLTLFDLHALRLPRGTTREQRARSQVLGVAFTAMSQGVAYLHAGVEILRSKSLDRDSFDSGDWFNRLDWSLTTNGFGAGLPPAHRNRDDWPVMRPVLADTSIAPTPAEIRWARDATLDLLRIRSSSTLFRLRTAADVRARLHFRNVGPAQDPVVIVGHIDGAGYAGARFRELLYFLNVAGEERTLDIPEEAGKAYVLHPVHRAPNAADRTAAQARVDVAAGRFIIPPRTAVVFVVE
ncbi:MAG: pullulanase-type alpha-1,6-glucosidase [Gemmatimonadota bacterium]